MKERIKQYMDYKNISAGELSSILGVQRSNISHILNGRNKPGASFIEKLLLASPDLNARWLFTAEGEMVEKADEKVKEPEIRAKNIISASQNIPFTDNIPDRKGIKPTEITIEKIVLFYSDGTFKDFNSK